ncbi:hypothetical protein [Fervidobacterium sp.]
MLNFLKTSVILRVSNGLQQSPPTSLDARNLFFHNTLSRFTPFKVFDLITVLVLNVYWSTEMSQVRRQYISLLD